MKALSRTVSLWAKIITFLDTWILFTFSAKLKFALKVSLSLTLSYMIPMAMGWNQPNTAAITVMLIATAGAVGESVMKGMIRIAGTLLGAVIGLLLISLFPQDRLLYLGTLSLVIGIVIYLYYAHQGDSTVFMLTAMMILMLFINGPEKAFLYGIDRTYMTVFGIVIYTLVGVLLWPVREIDSTIKDVASLNEVQLQVFKSLDNTSLDIKALHTQMLSLETRLETSYVKSSESSFEMALDLSSWHDLQGEYKEISSILGSLLLQQQENFEFKVHIKNYEELNKDILDLFEASAKAWTDKTLIEVKERADVEVQETSLTELSHSERALVTTHVILLNKLFSSLSQLSKIINYLNAEGDAVSSRLKTESSSRFIWLDKENIKGTFQLLAVFWTTTAFWIMFNPPLGFLLVVLATVLGLLTTFSPLKPSVLILIFSIGFIFSSSMYVFVLPNLVYGWQIGIFIFIYTFIAFYIIPAKMTIFFLLGMFLLGIGNTMSYNFDVYLNTLLVFYLFLLVLMFFKNFPFSSKPEYLFVNLTARFFNHATAILKEGRTSKTSSSITKIVQEYHGYHLHSSFKKLKLWGNNIDNTYFDKTSKEELLSFMNACESFSYQLQDLRNNEAENKDNHLLKDIKNLDEDNLLAEMSMICSQIHTLEALDDDFYNQERRMLELEKSFRTFKEDINEQDYTKENITDFYIHLGLRQGVWKALELCHKTMLNINWKQLRENRF